MRNRKFDWLVPAIVLVLGIFTLMNPEIEGGRRTLWWVLTPLALLLLSLRLYQRFNKKE